MLQIIARTENGWGHPVGHPQGLQVPNIATLFKSLPDILHLLGPKNQKNIYYTLAHHSGLGNEKPSRSAATFDYQTVVPFDIDHVDTQRVLEYASVVGRVLSTEPENLVVVNSGNGIQILAHLKHPIRSTKFLKELKPAYNEICYKIQKELDLSDLPSKVDTVVFDAARILRLPGTINSKPGIPDKAAVCVQYSDAQLDLDLNRISGLDEYATQNIAPDEVRRKYPAPDFQEMVKECRFMTWALEKPEELHEPHVFDLFSLLAAQTETSKIKYQGKDQTSKEVAEYVFSHASASKSLARQRFEDKWEGAGRYGSRKCSTIAKNWTDECRSCPHNGMLPTPLALKSKLHIVSEATGYWVLGSKGQHLHPNYGDLSRLFLQENPYVVTADKFTRIFTYDKTHYSEVHWPLIRSWVDQKVSPNDPLRDVHCQEFAKRIERQGMLTVHKTEALFEKSIIGKLNYRNGILDLVKGKFEPHSPDVGFKYVLPYDYEEGEGSEIFLDWLSEITKNDADLIRALLDTMAYCLWPTYDDHVFVFLIGEGSNGKSTFMNIMRAIVGVKNYSSVGLKKLGENKFAASRLEGKLVNLSSEDSGHIITSEELNVIKALSSGEPMDVEEKGTQGYSLVNKAKMIFAANKPPKFQEDGVAIQRRMLTIPFNYLIQKMDPNVEKALLADVPKIMQLLVKRIQENISENGGNFKVFRGGSAADEAQLKLLMAGNSVVEWAKENIESSSSFLEMEYVILSDAYAHYTKWCGLNGYKPVHKGFFSQHMYRFVITQIAERDKNKVYIGKKEIRVFKYTRWKEGEV